MRNEILEEVWRARDEFARRYNYDLDAMSRALREMEHRPGAVVVNREALLSKRLPENRAGLDSAQ